MSLPRILTFILMAGYLSVIGCGQTGVIKSGAGENTGFAASTKPGVSLSLTDAPNDDLKSVYVNVRHAELRVAGGGKEARIIVAENLGAVNLLNLQNGVTLPMANVTLPAGVVVTQIRLILNTTGNYIINTSDETCNLRIPSEAKTGIKLLIHGGVPMENGFNYSLVADFDAKKSVVQMGNGGCLLKPVLKLKSATKVAQVPPQEPPPPAQDLPPPPAQDGNVAAPPPAQDGGVVITLPVDGDNSGDGSGFDDTDEAAQPPVIPEANLDEFFGDVIQ